MPTPQHEALHRIFQEDTGLIGRVLTDVLRLEMPTPDKVEILNVDLTDLDPVSRWPDTLLRVESPDGPLIVVVEAQTDPSETKPRRWARYIAYLQDTYGCDVSLVVTCRKAATARWAAAPFEIGPRAWPSMVVRPIVLGPGNIPVITTLAEATRDIPLTVLSALVHGQSPSADAILEVLAAALNTIDKNQAVHLAEFTEGGLGEGAARQKWRTLMATQSYPYISEVRAQGRQEGRQEGRREGRQEGRQEGRREGRQEGEAKILLLMLRKRGIVLSDEERERIVGCADTEQLEKWADRAMDVSTAAELFA